MTLTNIILVIVLALTSLLGGCGTLGNGTFPQQAQQTGQSLQQAGAGIAQTSAAQGNPVGTGIGLSLEGIGTILALLGAAGAAFKGASAGNQAAAASLLAQQAHAKIDTTQGQVDDLYDATHMPIAQPPAQTLPKA